MTLNEILINMAENEKDENKIKCLTDISEFLLPYAQHTATGKIDGRKLFDLCEAFVKEWPEYVTAIIALSFMAGIGISNEDVDTRNIGGIDISEIMEM